MITVVNKKTVGPVPEGTTRVYVGRPSFLGNPYVLGKQGNRNEVIKLYEEWIRGKLKDVKSQQHREFGYFDGEMGNIELECWCAPLPCHADVLKKILEEEGFE